MRALTLNEKISIKGVLASRRAPSYMLVRLTMDDALYLMPRCTGRSVGKFHMG